MAGIKFWADMKVLDESFLQKAAGFKQIVPIFTNVIYDTSQPHANTVFEDMFDWLDLTLEVIRGHRDTLFVIRAHPDELRVRKASRETVEGWVTSRGVDREPNVVFVGPRETLSSYELIQKSKFAMVYNSTIGLEASILGAAVLCAGKARFTQYPTVFFPQTVREVRKKMEEFLMAERIDVPPLLVGTYDGTKWNLYRNGKLVANSASAVGAVPVLSGDWAVGATGNGWADSYAGGVDEVAIYDKALSESKVATHYLMGKAGTTALTIEPAGGGSVRITWPAGTTLQECATVNGTYTDIDPQPTSPWIRSATGTKFYRWRF